MQIQVIDKKKDKQYEPPKSDPDLPQLHFAMCVVGPRNRGKSLLIRNLLLRKDMLKNIFKSPNYQIIISPNIDVNGDFDEVEGKCVYKFDHFDKEMLNELMKTQATLIKKHGRKRTPEILIVGDDILDSGMLNFHSNVERIFSRGRHINMNIILVSQHLNRISRTMRLNCDYFIFFMPNNETELDDFLEQFISKPKRLKMRIYLKEMWAESIYNFILVDFKSKDINRRYRKNFSDPIILE